MWEPAAPAGPSNARPNRENTAHLDGVHTCFGKVVEGLDVIDKIAPGDLINSILIVDE